MGKQVEEQGGDRGKHPEEGKCEIKQDDEEEMEGWSE